MTADLVFELAAASEDELRITVRGTNGQAGEVSVDRPFPAIDAAKLDELRLGNAAAPVVEEVSGAISELLLQPDVAQRVSEVLDAEEHVRLVVSTDRSVRPRVADLPFELMLLPNSGVPLLLNPRVDALVHQLSATAAAPLRRDWPLKILVVRTNPRDLGGFVPPGAEVREAIREAAAALPEGSVEVTLLSSETPGAQPVTWRAFLDTLESGSWDVLVYLGHGDVREGVEPVSSLLFETADGEASDPVDTRKITVALFNHPVPVVILAGCLTAAELAQADADMQRRVESSLPTWLRGASGVAQALVDSEAGVQLAVGMRYRLEVDQAREFLAGFFGSLLKTAPGNTELAVRAGRNGLFQAAPIPPSWSAPVVFERTAPPVFPFLGDPQGATYPKEQKDKLNGFVEFRRIAARQYLQTTSDRAGPLSLLSSLAADEPQYLGNDAMVRPRFVSAPPGKVTVEVELVGSLKLRRLSGQVAIAGGSVEIDRLRKDPRLTAAGFAFLKDEEEGGRARFVIEREGGAGNGTLEPGVLFSIEATVSSTGPFVHEVSIENVRTDNKRRVWPGFDLIAVLPE